MAIQFEQIVIKAPFILTKGFVLGYRHSKPEGFQYFFNRKAGIRKETIRGHIKGFFDINQFSYLCIETSVCDDFVRAVKEVESFGMTIEDRSLIKSAEFKFSFEVFNQEEGNALKAVFENKGSDVDLRGYAPEERIDDVKKMRAKGSSHAYSYKGNGTANGPFEGVMNLYLATKKCKAADFVLCSEISLTL